MKVLFLDIDGPLVNHRSHLVMQELDQGMMSSFDPISVGLVNLICQNTGAKIVISSTWRLIHPDIKEILTAHGIKDEFHPDYKTPVTRMGHGRGAEIKSWLDNHPETKHWCAIDDNTSGFVGDLKDGLVKVNVFDGIGLNDYQKAVSLLTYIDFK